MTTPPEFTVRSSLRFSDFDILGHLNQAIYHVLLEQARVSWLRHVRPGQDWDTDTFVLARMELDHRREVPASEREIVATCRAEKVGTSSVTCAQRVLFTDGTVAAEGRAVLVGFDSDTRGKRVLADDERDALLG